MEEKDFYQLLVQRYIENKATEKELLAFFELLKKGELDPYLTDAMNAATFAHEPVEDETTESKRKICTLGRIVAAAVVLLIFSMGFYIASKSDKQQPQVAQVQEQTKTANDIAPGSDKAILIVADGSTITLEDKQNGVLAQQGHTKVVKSGQQLVYDASHIKPNEVSYNSIVTPRGGQYQITLADGTKVWLNAASSLRFPTAFTGKERRVELTGEAYFEVAHNAQKPFMVQKGATEVKVVGTHFNVNAYEEEPELKVTLLEGSVQVNNSGKTALLQPGQQAKIPTSPAPSTSIQVQTNTDVEQAVAWKNGVFQFEGADIQEVMRQVSRWYNVEVTFQKTINQHFTGTISRHVEASKVFHMLELTGTVHFKIDGKKIVVTS